LKSLFDGHLSTTLYFIILLAVTMLALVILIYPLWWLSQYQKIAFLWTLGGIVVFCVGIFILFFRKGLNRT